MKQKAIFVVACIAMVSVLFGEDVDAAKLDAYRTMMENKSFTLKYEIDLPEYPWENNSHVRIYEKKGKKYPVVTMAMLSNAEYREWIHPAYMGIVVVNGEDKYTEVTHKGYKEAMESMPGKYTIADYAEKDASSHFLQKGRRKFYYSHYFQPGRFGGGEYKYSGFVNGEPKVGKVEAGLGGRSPQEAMKIEFNYGHPVIGEILLAICPSEGIPAAYAPPTYDPAGEGTLDNGLFYEDYTSEKDGVFHAMRCYFEGNALVRVSLASYRKDAEGEVDLASYETRTVEIKEFSNIPDTSYLSLPDGLEDVTDGAKKNQGADDE